MTLIFSPPLFHVVQPLPTRWIRLQIHIIGPDGPILTIGSGELGLTANGINDQGLDAFSLIPATTEPSLPDGLFDSSQLASVPNGAGTFEEIPFASSSNLDSMSVSSQSGTLSPDSDIFSNGQVSLGGTGLGDNLFANTGGDPSTNLFSMADVDSSNSLGDNSLASNDAGTNLFSKRKLAKAKARAAWRELRNILIKL